MIRYREPPVCLTVTCLAVLTPHHSTYGSVSSPLGLRYDASPHMTADDDVVSPADAPTHTSKLPSCDGQYPVVP